MDACVSVFPEDAKLPWLLSPNLTSDLIQLCVSSLQMSSSKVLISHLFMHSLLMLKQHYVTVTALKNPFGIILMVHWLVIARILPLKCSLCTKKRLFSHHTTWVEQSSSSHALAFKGAPWHTIKLVKLDHFLQNICLFFFFSFGFSGLDPCLMSSWAQLWGIFLTVVLKVKF